MVISSVNMSINQLMITTTVKEYFHNHVFKNSLGLLCIVRVCKLVPWLAHRRHCADGPVPREDLSPEGGPDAPGGS